jgi:hypothetical protein
VKGLSGKFGKLDVKTLAPNIQSRKKRSLDLDTMGVIAKLYVSAMELGSV